MTDEQTVALFRLCMDRDVYIRTIEFGPRTCACLEVEYAKHGDGSNREWGMHKVSVLDDGTERKVF